MEFPPGGNLDIEHPENSTQPHRLRETFKFKDYAPEAYRQLRKRFGIDDLQYMLSLCSSFNFLELNSNSKSGNFFAYSHDGKYIIKTINR